MSRESLEEESRRRSSLAQRVLWWSLAISLIPLLTAMMVSDRYTTLVSQRAATELVSSLADVKSEQFQNHASERRADIHVLGHLRRVAVALEVMPREHRRGPEHSPEYLAAELDLRTYFNEVATSYAYDDVFLVSPEGDELFSLRQRGAAGTNYRTGLYRDTELAQGFEQALATREPHLTRFVPFERSGSPAAFISAPVFLKDAISGVLILQFGTESLLRITSDYSGLGRTGEVLLVQRIGDSAQFIAPTRHEPDAAFLNKIPLADQNTRRLRKALSGENGSDIGTDYRGVQTIAAWRYLPKPEEPGDANGRRRVWGADRVVRIPLAPKRWRTPALGSGPRTRCQSAAFRWPRLPFCWASAQTSTVCVQNNQVDPSPPIRQNVLM